MALPEISCSKYVPGEGRRCAHFLDGPCARPDEFMCGEWLQANRLSGARAYLAQVRATSPPPQPAAPPVQIALFPNLRRVRTP